MAEFGFLKPAEALEAWDVRPGEKIADFGCGSGFFTLELAKRVGHSGKIYAIDARPEALKVIQSKARAFHILNIETLRSDLELPRGSELKNESVDKTLISNMLFQADNKEEAIKEAARVTRASGSIAVIDWNEVNSPLGPSLDNKISKDEVKKMFEKNGVSFFKEFAAGSLHYGLIFVKNKA